MSMEIRRQSRNTVVAVTAFYSFATITLGMRLSQFGPAVTDLLLISGTDIKGGSIYLTGINFGFLAGCLTAGALCSRVKNKPLAMVLSLLLTATFTMLIPWCDTFATMLVANLLVSLFTGGYETLSQTEVVQMWKGNSESAMQAISFCYSFGSVLGPLVTEPFLAPKPDKESSRPSRNSSDNSTRSSWGEKRLFDVKATQSAVKNVSDIFKFPPTNLSANWNESTRNMISTGSKSLEYDIHYAYLITGTITCLASVPFVVLWIRSMKHKEVTEEKTEETFQSPQRRPLKVLLTLILLSCALFFFYSAMSDSFTQYLAYFVVNHFDWSKENGALVTSLYHGISTCVTIVVVLLTAHVDGGTVLFISCIGLAAASVLFAMASWYRIHLLVWVSTAFLSSSEAAIYGGVFSWVDSNLLQVDGKVTSAFLLASCVGPMVFPFPLGILMKEWSLMAFPLNTCALCVLMLSLYSCMLFIVKPIVTRKYGPPRPHQDVKLSNKEDEDDDDEEDEEEKEEEKEEEEDEQEDEARVQFRDSAMDKENKGQLVTFIN